MSVGAWVRIPLLALVLLLGVVAGCDLASPTEPGDSGGSAAVRPAGEVERARVVRVVDGDTVIMSSDGREERVRYIGIDAPESVRPNTPIEAHGREAALANARLVEGKVVLLERDVSDRDEFGWLLRYVWVESGEAVTFVNLELVRRGLATAVVFPPDVRHAERFRAAQREARSAGRGIWSATPSP